MNVIDSSAWLEYFAGSTNASHFAAVIEDIEKIIVPAIVLYEVFKVVMRERDEETAVQVIAYLKQCKVVEIDEHIAILAAQLSQKKKLPMADSLILAVTHDQKATLWTHDSDFKGLKSVQYFQKK